MNPSRDRHQSYLAAHCKEIVYVQPIFSSMYLETGNQSKLVGCGLWAVGHGLWPWSWVVVGVTLVSHDI